MHTDAKEGQQGHTREDEQNGWTANKGNDKTKHTEEDEKAKLVTPKFIAQKIVRKEVVVHRDIKCSIVAFPRLTVEDEYHIHGRIPIDAEIHRHVKVVNLWKGVKALTVHNIMNRYSKDKDIPCVVGVEIFNTEKENEVTATVRFLTKEDAFNAARQFSEETNWRWNRGFRAKMTAIFEFRTHIFRRGRIVNRYASQLRFHLRFPEMLGQQIDDVMSDIGPGCVVHLPAQEHFQPKTGVCVDVRFNEEIRGHPVIIVKRHMNYLVNVVLCTTFGGRSLEHAFRNHPERIREFIEVDSTAGHHMRIEKMDGRAAPNSPQGLLTFDGDWRLPLKGYAGTKVYTTSLQSLARLQMECLKHVPGGYLKLYNLQLLLDKIKLMGDNPDAEYYTSDNPALERGILPHGPNGRGLLATSVLNDQRLVRAILQASG